MDKFSIRMIKVNLGDQFEVADNEYIEDIQYQEYVGQFRVFIVTCHNQWQPEGKE